MSIYPAIRIGVGKLYITMDTVLITSDTLLPWIRRDHEYYVTMDIVKPRMIYNRKTQCNHGRYVTMVTVKSRMMYNHKPSVTMDNM